MKKRTTKGLVCVMLLLVFAMCALMLSSCAAELDAQGIKDYFEQKIIPIIAGALTALIALFASLKSIIKTLKELKSARDELGATQKEIEKISARELGEIKQKYDEISASTKQIATQGQEITEIAKSVGLLREQISRLSEIAYLGFSQDGELVRSGKSKTIAILSEQNQISEAENEA